MSRYARIDLTKTTYTQLKTGWKFVGNPDPSALNEIYRKYCRYKKFESVMPIFDTEYTNMYSDVIAYYDGDHLAAFSLIKIHDHENVECVQFAWDYADPKLRLGIESLKHECALYRDMGYRYMYLGEADEYKSHIKGYEELGPI
jgi:hypothetical protein